MINRNALVQKPKMYYLCTVVKEIDQCTMK
nr:MAG TPA: hypothetical protein [Caudoviricetes sp.]